MKKYIACFTAAIMTMAVFTGCILKKETERTEKSKINVESTEIQPTVDTSTADSSATEEVETSVGNDESVVSEESEDESEIELYEDILKNPYSHTAIIDPSSTSFNNHSYFIADINSDNKYELVIKDETKVEDYDPYGVLTIVNADKEVIKWEYSNTPDFHADGIISYGRVATHFPQYFVNINSGDLWEAGSFQVGNGDSYKSERELTNKVTGETIQGETADKKEEELSSGALLYPKWTDYDVYNAKDTKIVVLEKEDIEYNWRNAYLKLIEDMETSENLSGCALLYIDNDDIPELYIVPSYSDCGKMYSFYNGKLIENTSFNSGGYSLDYYVERTGKLCGRMIPVGGIHLLYQEYQNGEFKDILYASSTGYDNWHGTINDVEVTEQEYNSQVDAVEERDNATPIVLKSYQEIELELIDTYGN